LDSKTNMHRLTARLLLFFALVGNLAPLALATVPAPLHACCLRKKLHSCHDSPSVESEQPVISDSGCCNHDCCGATVCAHWAHPESQATSFLLQPIYAGLAGSNHNSPTYFFAQFQSSRAPPSEAVSRLS
jgi:hypothetical protein